MGHVPKLPRSRRRSASGRKPRADRSRWAPAGRPDRGGPGYGSVERSMCLTRHAILPCTLRTAPIASTRLPLLTVDAYPREFDLPADGCHRLGMVEVRRPVRGSPPGCCEARYQCYDAAQGD